jgi:hypothetical protein
MIVLSLSRRRNNRVVRPLERDITSSRKAFATLNELSTGMRANSSKRDSVAGSATTCLR